MNRFVLSFAVLLAQQVNADTINVQSGDHPGFTRLVLSVPTERDWRLGRQGDSYRFEAGDPTDIFDVSKVFDRIARNRLSGFDTGGTQGSLGLTLACNCHATAFRWQEDWVIIDIVDGPAALGSRFETEFEADQLNEPIIAAPAESSLEAFSFHQTESPLSEFRLTDSLLMPHDADTSFVLPLVMNGISDVTFPAILPDPEVDITAQADPEKIADGNRIGETEQAIIESLARAASQGLLDVSVAHIETSEPEVGQHHSETEKGEELAGMHPLGEMITPTPDLARSVVSSLAEFDLQLVNTDQPGIQSRTSVDMNSPPAMPQEPGNTEGTRCLDDSLFDMDEWGDERDFSVQISEGLSGLTTEFDVYPEGAVENMVRSYLYFGFGREALQALQLDGIDSQQRRVMAAMAYVADDEPDPKGLLDSQIGCASQVTIWMTLSRGTLAGTTEAERVAAIAGFRTLPTMLRGHLGVRLAQIFKDFGDAESARSILDTAQDQITADRSETDVIAADILLATLGAEAAIPALEDIAEGNTRITPDALICLIDLTRGHGHPVDPDLISLAESMVYEHRGEAAGAMLIAAQARALTAAGAYAQTFSLLDGDTAPMEIAELAALRSEAILALTEKVDDASFLNFAFDALPETGNSAVENKVAARLLALGFPDRSIALLTSDANGADARERRYLEAEIALALGDFVAVEEHLVGMNDPRASNIRALALTAQGEFAAAAAAINVLPGATLDPAEAWRAGEWQTLEQSDDALLQAASGAVLSPPMTPDPVSPLTQGRALLEQATVTRDLTGQLLERFAVEPAPEPAGTN